MNSELINTIYVHLLNFVFAGFTVAVLISILYQSRNVRKSFFVLLMLNLPLVSMIHVTIYSLVLFIDHLDGVINFPLYVNMWSLFVTSQYIMSMCCLSILAYIKYRNGGLFK
jgi:hypothetical protein